MQVQRYTIPDRALDRLAVFPLPNTIFFPHTILPLHIFEPRYREMTRDAVETGMPIAVVLAHPEGVVDAHGRPAFHEVAGVGVIIDHERLADGRFNILLLGVGRVRVVRELESDTSYRQVEASWIEETGPDLSESPEYIATLRNSIMTLQRLHPQVGTPLMKMASKVDDPEAIVDIMSSVIFPEVHRRQHLLGEPSFDNRYRSVLSRITDLLVEGAQEPPGGDFN